MLSRGGFQVVLVDITVQYVLETQNNSLIDVTKNLFNITVGVHISGPDFGPKLDLEGGPSSLESVDDSLVDMGNSQGAGPNTAQDGTESGPENKPTEVEELKEKCRILEEEIKVRKKLFLF